MWTFIAFIPSLFDGFVVWDDPAFIMTNEIIRGFGPSHLKQMFFGFIEGNYAPLSLLSWAVDYKVWGSNPLGYHLHNLILHGANAVLVYFIALLLFKTALVSKKHAFGPHFYWCSALAALLFSVHPLRVESVTWATERRDVLSTFFYLLAILSYLKAHTGENAEKGSKKFVAAAVVFMFVSQLAKAWAMSVPFVLLLLDFYPLRRIGTKETGWFTPQARAVLKEKAVFLLVALPLILVAPFAQHQAAATASLTGYGPAKRLTQSAYGLIFYLWKTVWPFGLIPLYELPDPFNIFEPRFIATSLLAVGGMYYFIRRRMSWPAGAVTWFTYFIIVAPVLGFVQAGAQIAADRYTYISCIPWPILAAGGVLAARQDDLLRRKSGGFIIKAGVVCGTVLLFLSVLTWRQAGVWYDTGSLWNHVVKVAPNNVTARYNMAVRMAQYGNQEEAIKYYLETIKLNPRHVKAHNNLASIYDEQGKLADAETHYREAIKYNPGIAGIYANLARVLIKENKTDEAVAMFKKSLELESDNGVLAELQRLLEKSAGGGAQSMDYYRDFLQKNPNNLDARITYGSMLNQAGRYEQAVAEYGRVLAAAPNNISANNNIANALAKLKRYPEAKTHYLKAIAADPRYVEAYVNLGVVLTWTGDLAGAETYFRKALSIDPKNGTARSMIDKIEAFNRQHAK